MRKYLFILPLFLLLFVLGECSANRVKLPKCIDKECYYSEGIQDYTDFCKYYYDEKGINEFKDNDSFAVVKASDIENIKSYFDNFEECVSQEDFADKYDFDSDSQIKEGDYFYIDLGDYDDPDEKFYYYDLYYVDTQKKILYFIHSNI